MDLKTQVFGAFSSACLDCGTLILVPHCLQRTVFPRATLGTESTFLQVRFGHIIRSICSDMRVRLQILRSAVLGYLIN